MTYLRTLTLRLLRIEPVFRARDEAIAKANDLNREVSQLRRKLRFYEKRSYSEDILPTAHNTVSSMDKFFEAIEDAEVYREFGRALRVLMDEHGISIDGKAVMDWGVGPGLVLSEVVANKSPKSVTGHDFSVVALSHAREAVPEGDFSAADIYQPASRRFDVILCTEVLEHLTRPEIALRNLWDAMSDEGVLVVTVPEGRTDYSRYHINFWSPESWPHFLEVNLPKQAVIRAGVFKPYADRVVQNNFAFIRRR